MLRKADGQLPAEARQLAEWLIGPEVRGDDRERRVENEMRRLQRGVQQKGKHGPLADLVELDRHGEPLKPYRFYLPEIFDLEE
jgi:hypothetical protein